MDRNEFLAALEAALKGEIPDYEITGHVRYYDSYLQENNGKTEEEKLNELGDPRLIAKTIIDAAALKGGNTNYRGSYENRDYTESSEPERQQENRQGVHYKTYTWDGLTWYQKLLALVILVLVVVVLLAVAGLGIHIFFSIVLPVLVIVFVIKMVMSFFR